MRSLFLLIFVAFIASCNGNKDISNNKQSIKMIDNITIDRVVKQLIEKYGDQNRFRIDRGVRQVASLWRLSDGTKDEFGIFCFNQFINNDETLHKLFLRINENFEVINGNFNRMSLDLNKPIQLEIGEIIPVDEIFAAWQPSSHLSEDFYNNKIAFIIALNFPFLNLEEKINNSARFSDKDWAYARAGDLFTSRVPSDLQQNVTSSMSVADNYISNYNIFMGNLRDSNGNELFPKDLKLITHWNLRDEIKSQYALSDGLQRQNLIYQVMLHIVEQTIPSEVINNDKYLWNPINNQLFDTNGKIISSKKEDDTRYEMILNCFNAQLKVDEFSPNYPTYISRKFDHEMEMPVERVEKLFTDFISSPVAKEVAELIKNRLGRNLQPFDIWYDGFKARSNINEEELSSKTRIKYPNAQAVKDDLPNILQKLGWSKDRSDFLSSKILVDPSRGAGHASGALMRDDFSHLRTRIGLNGMDYKGYNIAVHEFGHNVEQTISLHEVPFHLINGIPNTAFTEAIAFVFQKRDLELLGIKENNPQKDHLLALDNFWSTFEIMGVALVDINLWKWLYEHPKANKKQVREAVISISKDIWNKYYAPVIGIKDSPILGIYSHMIDYPLYLSAYPIGHIIEFQLENYLKDKDFSDELDRILKQGRLTPDAWMLKAVGSEISIEPTLRATKDALQVIK